MTFQILTGGPAQNSDVPTLGHVYHTPFGFLHHSTTTWVTTWGPHPGPPPTFWVMVLAQSTTFWRLRFSAAGGARPAFRSPNWWFVYWSSGFLWLHSPPSTRHLSIGVPARPILTSHMAWDINTCKWPARNAHHAPEFTPTIISRKLQFAVRRTQLQFADVRFPLRTGRTEISKYRFIYFLFPFTFQVH